MSEIVGRAKNGIRLTGMAALGPAYSADQIWELVFYVREVGREKPSNSKFVLRA